MLDRVLAPWPWYVAGPLVGLVVPLLLIVGGKVFGISTSFQHVCAATLPGRLPYLNYDWRAKKWQLALVLGLVLGGALGGLVLSDPDAVVAISGATRADLEALGVTDFTGLVPRQWVSWEGLLSLPGFAMVVVGGFLVGFGARYADGCTSGHAIMGLSSFQLPSLIAVIGFFAGGLISVHILLPIIFGGGG